MEGAAFLGKCLVAPMVANGGKCLVPSREIYSPARPSRLREVRGGDDDEHSKMLAYCAYF